MKAKLADAAIQRLIDSVASEIPQARFQLIRDNDDQKVWGLFIYSNASRRRITELTIDEVSRLALEGLPLYVVPASQNEYVSGHPGRSVHENYNAPIGAPITLTQDEARTVVRSGIGTRPDLPTGSEYVNGIKGSWEGLPTRG